MTPGQDHKLVQRNRKAFHDYSVLDRLECGVVLVGSEVKSVRAGNVSIKEAHGRIDGGEGFLLNMNISAYDKARENHDPNRKRKLLLHSRELRRLKQQLQEKGLAWIPLSIYFQKGRLKVEMGLCQGKKRHDKREKMKRDDARREMERFVKRGS
ncbi:MAG: SsrA-binding protein SmpB [Planctomycetota bacterium]|nr:SsrA-binding protein SmpB [Planctomycetota bacterium]